MIMRGILYGFCGIVFSACASAHEMTPTYPEFNPSFVEGVYKTSISIFNRRTDVSYYSLQVYDNQWEPIPFAAETNLISLKYLEKKSIDIYLRVEDIPSAGYICTKSKILKGEATSVVSSRICSKIK